MKKLPTHLNDLAARLGCLEMVEPPLHQSATYELATRAPLDEVAAAVLRLSGVEEQHPTS